MTNEPEFPIFGGPLDGAHQPATATIYADREGKGQVPAEPEQAFRYTLVDHSGRRAFVPVDDRDLVAAFHDADGDPGGAKATILAAELERRGVDL